MTCSRCHQGEATHPTGRPAWCAVCKRDYNREYMRQARANGKWNWKPQVRENKCQLCGYEWTATRSWQLCWRCRGNDRPPRRVPAAPLLEIIEHATVVKGGLMELCREFGLRYGVTLGTPWTQVQRMRRSKTVEAKTADEWCIFLGRHPGEVYGEGFYHQETAS